MLTSNSYFQPSFSYQKINEDFKYSATVPSVLKVPTENVTANAGTDVRLNCTNKSTFFEGQVAWIHQSAKEKDFNGRTPYHPSGFITDPKDGSILFTNLTPMQDDGIYTCVAANNTERKLRIIRLRVKSIPSAVTNLSVIPHSVYALVTWQLPFNGDGGYPILRFVLSYRLGKSHLRISDNNSSLTNQEFEKLAGTPTQFSTKKNTVSISKEEFEWRGNYHPINNKT